MLSQIENEGINIIINNACQTVRQSKTLNTKLLSLEFNIKLIVIEQNEQNEQNVNSQIILNDQLNTNPVVIFNTGSHQVISLNDSIEDLNKIKSELNMFNDFKDEKDNISWDKSIEDIEPGEIVEATLIN